MSKQFWEVLFDPEERTCFTNSPYHVDLFFVHELNDCRFQYFSINPMTGSRRDSNVTFYRNILLEFDTLRAEEQKAIIDTIPHSTLVWSGVKSYHCIISLQDPCETRTEYDALVRRIMAKVPQADPSTKNPSRLSRFPGTIRQGTTQPQELVHVNSRITKAKLEAWLGPEKLKTEQYKPVIELPEGMPRIRKGSTSYFLEFGATEGYWNRELFLAALDLLRCGTDEEQVRGLLAEVTGRLDKSDLRTIQSAVDTWRRDG